MTLLRILTSTISLAIFIAWEEGGLCTGNQTQTTTGPHQTTAVTSGPHQTTTTSGTHQTTTTSGPHQTTTTSGTQQTITTSAPQDVCKDLPKEKMPESYDVHKDSWKHCCKYAIDLVTAKGKAQEFVADPDKTCMTKASAYIEGKDNTEARKRCATVIQACCKRCTEAYKDDAAGKDCHKEVEKLLLIINKCPYKRCCDSFNPKKAP